MKLEWNSYFKFLTVGFVAMAGGIVMFIIVVPKWDQPQGQAPVELSLIFTKVYSIQANLKSAGEPFSPDIYSLGVEQDECQKYQCNFRLIDLGKDYEFRLSKNHRTWMIHSSNMIPVEVTN